MLGERKTQTYPVRTEPRALPTPRAISPSEEIRAQIHVRPGTKYKRLGVSGLFSGYRAYYKKISSRCIQIFLQKTT